MKRMHMIGNAHLDPAWLWEWQEGFHETKATFKSMLDRMEEYDDVVFTSSSAQSYEWVEKNDPTMFARIVERVKEGRWVICNGWWVQADCNIPCGESFARQALISQNYFKEKFGIISKTGYNVDSFGHNGMLPQILKLSGMDNYVFMRPDAHEKGLPANIFIWESQDGSRVYAYRIPYFYTNAQGLTELVDVVSKEFQPGVDDMMAFYGVGNHGGGPTIANINEIHEVQKQRDDLEVIFSDPNSFFKNIAESGADLPVVHGDLHHHAIGCYSANSEIKRLNRKAENALLKAEKISVLAEVLTGILPVSDFTEGWKRVLFNQFHDILGGCSIEAVYESAKYDMGEALAIAGRNENNGIQAIAFGIQIEQEDNMIPVVVFNPHSWDVEENIELRVRPPFPGIGIAKDDFVTIKDVEGKELPVQRIQPDNALFGGPVRMVFPAKIPALGYATFRIYGEKGKKACEECSGLYLENDKLKVEFDEATGGISSIYMKEEKRNICHGIAGRAVVMNDATNTWGENVVRFQNLEGYFTPVSMKKIEEGQVRSTVYVVSKYKNSTLKQTYTLYKNEEMIRVSAKIDWQEPFCCVKIQFPVKVDIHYHGTCEIPFGTSEKACYGEEQPMQNWMDITGVTGYSQKNVAGMAVISDCKCSGSMECNRMDLTVLRSSYYAYEVGREILDGFDFLDHGIHSFRYAIVPHNGDWKEADIVRKALMFNQPCTALIETYHDGPYLQKAGFMHVDQENIVMTALKKAHKGEGYIVRFYETYGRNTTARIDMSLFGKKFTVDFKANEIKTFLITGEADQEPVEVNFLEWSKDMP